VEERLAERGVIVTYETVRQWCRKFGQSYANALRRRRPRTGDKWHLDEVFVQINGVQHYLWRAVDQDALAKINQMGGGVPADPQPFRPEHRFAHRDDTSLPVGSGDVHRPEPTMRISETFE